MNVIRDRQYNYTLDRTEQKKLLSAVRLRKTVSFKFMKLVFENVYYLARLIPAPYTDDFKKRVSKDRTKVVQEMHKSLKLSESL